MTNRREACITFQRMTRAQLPPSEYNILRQLFQKLISGLSNAKDVHEAIHQAFLTSGNAIFITAVTMIAPLIPWAVASPLRFQAEMGMLLALVLFMNMLGSLLFVPAAIAAFHPKALFKIKENAAQQ